MSLLYEIGLWDVAANREARWKGYQRLPVSDDVERYAFAPAYGTDGAVIAALFLFGKLVSFRGHAIVPEQGTIITVLLQKHDGTTGSA